MNGESNHRTPEFPMEASERGKVKDSSKDYKYNKYNIINIVSKKSYQDYLLELAKQKKGAVTFYMSLELWEEFCKVVKQVDPFKSRSQLLEELILDWCLKQNQRDMKITQFIFNQPENVNITPKVKVNIAQKLEVKLVKKELTAIIAALEKGKGDTSFYTQKLKELLSKAIQVYRRVEDSEIEELLKKAEKWI